MSLLDAPRAAVAAPHTTAQTTARTTARTTLVTASAADLDHLGTTLDIALDTALDPAAAQPPWVLRVNPLRRRRLADGDLRDLLGRLAASEQDVLVAFEQCDADLYELIGEASDVERRQLVQLRRTIRNDRAPEQVPAIASLVRWASAHARRRQLREEVAAAHATCTDRERATLAGLLGDEHVRSSLSLLVPEVFDEAQRYVGAYAPGVAFDAKARKSARKSERGLIQYVTRAMVRTSPLARFTAVGLAIPGTGGAGPGDVTFDGATAFPGLDRVMLAYVLGGLGRGVGEDLRGAWVGLSPTSRLDIPTRTFYFLRPTEGGFARCAAPAVGDVRLLLEAVAMGPRDVASLARELADRTGRTEAQATALLQGAVGTGVLCTYEQGEDGTVSLQAMLSAVGGPAAGRLEDVGRRLATFAAAPVPARAAELAAIKEDLGAVSRLAQRPAHVPVAEDYVLAPTTVDPAPWRGPLTDLGAAVEVLSVFDWLHDVRVLTSAAFVERFGAGAGVPLVQSAGELLDEVSRRVTVAGGLLTDAGAGVAPDPQALAAIAGPDRTLERLYALRRRILETARVDVTRAVEEGRPEVRWSATDVAALTEGLPGRFRRDPLSYGALVQPVDGGLVFNDGLPGHGMLYSRFLGPDAELGGQALAHLRSRLLERYGQDGSRVVEDLGLHRLNVNAHPQILPEGLRAGDWSSLRLVHDPETDALRVEDGDGRPMRVLALGTGHPALFPAPLSVATCLTSAGRLSNTLVDHWRAATAWDGQRTEATPRISVGDVVVARRRWYGGAELDTALAAGPADHDRVLAVTAWRSRHGVPEEVVVKSTLPEDNSELLQGADTAPRRQQRKPQYADLASALGNRVLPRMLERRAEKGSVTFLEEALPGVVDDTNAYEWVVEIGRGPGGHFHYEGDIR